ncbi:MAG: calcium-binding protein, partial [Nitrospirota bacterium]
MAIINGTSGDDVLNGGAEDDIIDGLAGNDELHGGGGQDSMFGGAGNDYLDGGTGADTMAGGVGDDDYVVDNAFDLVVEAVGEGSDRVFSSVDYTLTANVEYLTLLSGSAAVVGTGNALDNEIVGNQNNNNLSGGDGFDFLDGRAGADTMAGGTGDDDYVVDNALDSVVEAVGEGFDTINSAIDYTVVASNTERLILLAGSAAVSGTGDAQNNVIVGNQNDNILSGLDGNDYLDGGTGADTMTGGTGDDDYVVDNAFDSVVEVAGEGFDTINSAINYTVVASNTERLMLIDGSAAVSGTGDAQNNVIVGNQNDNILSGLDGNDFLDGRAGADTMTGGTGDDDYVVDNAFDSVVEAAGEGSERVFSSVDYALTGNVELLVLLAGSAAVIGTGNALDNEIVGNQNNNILNGLDGNDELHGGAGQDSLFGGAGADTLLGDAGDDIYGVDQAGDVVTEQVNEGIDTVQSSVDYTLGANVENLTLTGFAVNGTGNSLNNTLIGNSAANLLTGGAGDDTYGVDQAGDVVTEQVNEGIDTVQSAASVTLGANVEHLVLTGTDAIDGTGNELNNTLTGNSAANALTGGAGADTLLGGAGDDTYGVDDAGDLVTEQVNEGLDTVQSSVSYTLGANLENLTLTGTGAIDGTGNSLNNVLTGNSAANILTGGDGDDIYFVDNVADTVVEAATEGTDDVWSSVTFTLSDHVENLALTGVAAIDGTGNSLNNLLRGNSAANVLTGGAGDDIYVVGTGDTDTVVEALNEGTDWVQSLVSFALSDNVEILTFNGIEAIDGTGNSADNILGGNSAANSLTGGAGDDSLMGRAGDDSLIGDEGDDSLDGGTGADIMAGGLGDDTYLVDNVADTVVEAATEGTDEVFSSVTFTLSDHVENLTLTGVAAIDGTGNSLNNILTDNSAANVLTGGAGDDTYNVGTGDSVVEQAAEGSADLVQSSVSFTLGDNVENLTLTGTDAIDGTGNSLNNILTGNLNSAANVLTGGAGHDTYIVGAGDSVVEAANEGVDHVQSSVTFTLSDNIEKLTL